MISRNTSILAWRGSLYYFISEKGFQKIPTEKKILTMELTADPEKESYVKTQISELISEENKKRSEMTEVSMDEGTAKQEFLLSVNQT